MVCYLPPRAGDSESSRSARSVDPRGQVPPEARCSDLRVERSLATPKSGGENWSECDKPPTEGLRGRGALSTDSEAGRRVDPHSPS